MRVVAIFALLAACGGPAQLEQPHAPPSPWPMLKARADLHEVVEGPAEIPAEGIAADPEAAPTEVPIEALPAEAAAPVPVEGAPPTEPAPLPQ